MQSELELQECLTQPYFSEQYNSLMEAHQSIAVLLMHKISRERNHDLAFHAWVTESYIERRIGMRDLNLFLSVSFCASRYLTRLVKNNLQMATEFVNELVHHVVQLYEEKKLESKEWFSGLTQLIDAFIRNKYIAQARLIVAISMKAGVNQFPEIMLYLFAQSAYLDAASGQWDNAHKAVTVILQKLFLIKKENASFLYHKIIHVLAASQTQAEYRYMLWTGTTDLYIPDKLRDDFTRQLTKVYGGVFRVLLDQQVALMHRLLFPFENIVAKAAKSRMLTKMKIAVILRILYRPLLRKVNRFCMRHPYMMQAVTNHSVAKRILVTREMGGLGDILLMTPGLLALAKKDPTLQIDFALPKQFHPVLEGFSSIQVLDIFKDTIRLNHYQRWINLTDCPAAKIESLEFPKIQSNRVENFARGLGISRQELKHKLPIYQVKAEEFAWAKSYLKQYNPQELPVIAIQPLAAESYRDWPYMEQLAKTLSQTYFVLILHHQELSGFNGPNIKQVLQPIRKSIALAACCYRLITPDSSFVHIAAALGIKTVALFGPTSGQVICRDYQNVLPISPAKHEFPCSPCYRNEFLPCQLSNGRESVCMRSISCQTVLDALNLDETQLLQREELEKNSACV